MSNVNGLRKAGVVLTIAMLASVPAWAQTGLGTIVGTVTDAATKQPVVDVVVTATAPSLPGEQIVVTNASGQFRIPQLPAGTYTLRFDKESYRPFVRTGIPLRIDTTVRVNTEMLPETAGSTDIVVEGRAPTIDVGSATVGVNVSSDFVRNLAVIRPTGKGGAARSFESLAAVAPGAQADEYGVSIAGTTSPENSYLIDGISVNDPAFGILGSQMSVEFVSEVNVITGGYMPEFGRTTGGAISAVTKSGSNEFHGDVFATWTPGVLQAESRAAAPSLSSIRTTSSGHNIGDFGATLGGPILKDKLWFFVGFNPSFQRNRYNASFHQRTRAAGPAASGVTNEFSDTPYFEYSRFADARTFQYIGKLTYAINADHTINLSVFGAPTTSGGKNSFGFDDQTGAAVGSFAGPFEGISPIVNSAPLDVSLKINNAFLDKRLLLDTTLGWHHQTQSTLPREGSGVEDTTDPSTVAGTNRISWRRTPGFTAAGMRGREFHDLSEFVQPGAPEYEAVQANCGISPTQDAAGNWALCPMGAYSTGGAAFISEDVLDRFQGKSIATFIFNALGSHAAKAGVDFEYLTYNRKKAYGGTAFLREETSGTVFQENRNFGQVTGPGSDVSVLNRFAYIDTTPTSTNLGAFLQDSWNVANLFTLNVGLRYDAQTMVGADGRTALALPNQWSPRVGVVYDPTQQGRSKVFANYARFFETVPLNIGDRAFGGESSVQAYHARSATCNPLVNGDNGLGCLTGESLLPDDSYIDPNDGLFYSMGADRATVDPNLKPQSTDEIVAGGEYQIIENGRLGAQYTKRYMNTVIEDMSRDEAATYFIGNPGEGIAKDFPKARRDYDAVNVYFTKEFADLWLAQVSYTWSDLRGNWAGLFRPETGQLDPNLNADFDLQSLLPNRDGPLPGDRRHSIKAYAAKEFVFGGAFSVNLGLTYQVRSGTPLNVYGRHALYGEDEVFLLPRGAGGRMPWAHYLDGTIGFNVKLNETNTVTLGVDVFNLFNWAQIAGKSESYTFSNVLPVQDPSAPKTLDPNDTTPLDVLVKTPGGAAFNVSNKNPNYGQVTGYQLPRNVGLSARFTF